MFSLIKYFFWGFLLLVSATVSANFQSLTHFGENPGELSASYLAPSNSSDALVVFLHGCVQNAETLAQQSGFVALAKQYNFTLLLPQQSQKNNVKSCFNWFSEQDFAKDHGEVLSIKNMIKALIKQTASNKVYIAGLSAGGAMTSALLTHYPHLFSAGAVIAGLPYPCANDLAKAISCMRNGPSQSIEELVTLAKHGNEKVTRWPRLIVITGNNDKVVNPKNSQKLAWQWSRLSDEALPVSKKLHQGYQQTLWQDTNEESQVELLEINEISHGLTVNSSLKSRDTSANFIYESPLDSATNIIEFWGFSMKKR